MPSLLGIDAAWTLKQPSGVALVAGEPGSWRLIAAESSYQRFLAGADRGQEAEERPSGGLPDAAALLSAAKALTGAPVDVVAIDMPLALSPITARRVSDNAVTRAYGARWCGTHSPNATRPGRISDELRAGFEAAGYRLQTSSFNAPGLIEVYPHPALVELAREEKRLPYKAANARKYWRDKTPDERRVMLLEQWAKIVRLLEEQIGDVETMLPRLEPAQRGWQLKAYEDVLDAVVCAWVAACVMEGRAQYFGDADSSIWIPSPMSS